MTPTDRPASKRAWPYLLAALIMVALWFGSLVEFRSDTRPLGTVEDIVALRDRDDLNVLFLLVDTVRADHLSHYGYERETSPHLDGLAETGVRFARHTAQSSWTKCSMASMWTGLYPQRSGVLRLDHALPEEATLPAEILRDAGLRTAGIWRNGWVAPNFGFGQGFELYVRPRPGPVPASVRRENPSIRLEGTDQDVIASALEFLRTHGSERWMLYLHLMDVHQYVFDEDSALFGSRYSDMYDNSIRWTDRLVGALLGYLNREGLRSKTLIVFLSDHGEAFGEHGFEGHARNLYTEVIDTPLVLGLPFRLEEGLVINERSANVDVWPTVLDLLGFPVPKDLDGRSFRESLLESARFPNRVAEAADSAPIFSHLDQTWGQARREPDPTVAVTDGDYRLVHRAGLPDADELYDHATDPDEQSNLARAEADLGESLRDEVDAYLEASGPPPWGVGAKTIELDDMELNQLRALGYSID